MELIKWHSLTQQYIYQTLLLGPEDHRDVGDAGRGEVLELLLQLPHLHHPGPHIPGGGALHQGARDGGGSVPLGQSVLYVPLCFAWFGLITPQEQLSWMRLV